MSLHDAGEFSLLPLSVDDRLRDSPTEDFIALMRRLFPVEREMDAILTRKLRRRASGPQEGVSLDRMSDWLGAFLRHELGGQAFEISDQRWFAGGASKIQMGFSLTRGGGEKERLVVRMEPAESLNSTSRAREFELVQAFEGIVPVPRPYWVDADGAFFPEPALIYAFADGVTKPPRTSSGSLSGIGTQFSAELRAKLAPQFVRHLAAIHSLDVSRHAFAAFDRPAAGTTESALQQLQRARRVWEEDRTIDIPLMEVAANWLERHLPVLDRISVVHGDYRSGNFLFDLGTSRITSVLDWERGYLGDRHRDLAWTASRVFGSLAEDGKTFLASGLVEEDAFFAQYEKDSGLSVDPQRLRFYTLFNAYQVAVAALGTSARVVKLAKSHQDILLAATEPVGWGAAEMLRRALEETL